MATTSIRLDAALVSNAEVYARVLDRTPPKQIEHWIKIGRIMEDNPDLPYEFVQDALLAKAETTTGNFKPYERRTKRTRGIRD
ncbi:putative ParD-like antitoxin [Shewanella benthica]|uniref:Putative ParD-like antitoxin n=2 Tax=Shewanella benthica TaxID=43661 RepID=A0A330M6J0_9GAMM|nr:hypothetical protein [Shewanella benthica]MBE7216520.1 hypothetical protein [Shewanella benthica]MCL1064522.1 ParD-like family protein [Shewanella benthica]SQH75377.1 putative ParD-like antitoxin [Shewanella benthica]